MASLFGESGIGRLSNHTLLIPAVFVAFFIGQSSTELFAQTNGCSVEINISNTSGFLDVSLVDPVTFNPLSACPAADATGEFALSGVISVDGDTTNFFGNVEVNGRENERLETSVTVTRPSELLAASGQSLFVSLLVGIELDTFMVGDGDALFLGNALEVVARDTAGPHPETGIASLSTFAETSDGFSTFVPGASVSGVYNIPSLPDGLRLSGQVIDPQLPSGTMETGFSNFDFQLDLGFFDVSLDGDFTVEATTQTVIAVRSPLPGDFNNDGVVDAADFTVWRDSLGASGEGLDADGDLDGDVDIDDFLIWQATFGVTVGGGELLNVPEPGAGLLAPLSLFLLAIPRAFPRRHWAFSYGS